MNNEDCISRAALLSRFTFENGDRIPEVDCDNFPITVAIKDVKRIIREAPSVPPQVGQSNDVIYSLADMVLQFGCAIERKGKKYIHDEGLSALERAFSVLEDSGCPIEQDGTIRLDRLLEFMTKMDGGEDDA